MTCYHPVKAYRSSEINPATGKRQLTFNPVKNYIEGNSITLPCGKCIGCRIDRSEQWATRCLHESKMHAENAFITLTYDDKNLPEDYSVQKEAFQSFMKSLRHQLSPKRIRFFASGEYGDETQRPHYHALIFGHSFNADKVRYSKSGKQEHVLYTSNQLSKSWPYGLATLGDVTHQSAGYVARYCIKKIGGDKAAEHYTRQHPVNKTFNTVEPEFSLSSRRPGIGSTWFDKFQSDAFPSDFLVVDGKMKKPPRFYLKKLKEEEQTPIKRKRKRESLPQREHTTKERLAVREEIKTAKLKRLKRELK